MAGFKLSLLLVLVCTAVAAASGENTVIEIFTVEKRGLAGWESRESSCKYAITAAKNSASARCTKQKGELLQTFNTSCDKCKQTEYFNEWYCSGTATVQCKYETEKPDTTTINKMRGMLQDKYGQPYTETHNPCVRDTQTMACKNYRNAKKHAGGVRN
ncbi:MAG: hypothetical protein ACJAUP_000388 [Cellvibrionaceae bacterium]|jgi:hypothetical protein